MARSAGGTGRSIAVNRKARRDYFIDETFEAGIVLQGSEVKSMRAGRGSINESYATEQAGEIYLVNAHIPNTPPRTGKTTIRDAPASFCCTVAKSNACWARSNGKA